MGVRQNEKTGHWEVDFRDQHRKRIQRTFKRKKDADDFYNETRLAVRQGTYVKPSKDTVAEKADEWLTAKKATGGYRYGTLQNWDIHIEKYIKPELGHLLIQRVTIKDVEQASLKWAARRSGNTANMVLRTCSAIFDLAQRWGPLPSDGTNVAAKAMRIKLTTEDEDDGEILPEDVYTEEELARLVKATDPGTLDRLILQLGGFCGLRIGEILGFTWPAIDLRLKDNQGTPIRDRKLRVIKNLVATEKDKADFPGYGNTGRALMDPKSKRSKRAVDAPRELVHDLRLWKLKCPVTSQQIVMATMESVPLQRSAAQDMLDAACERAEVPRRTLHRLRHTFGSLLIKKGVDIPTVSRLLGHTNVAFTWKVYVHFIDDHNNAVQELATSVMKHSKKR
jgi:integrase